MEIALYLTGNETEEQKTRFKNILRRFEYCKALQKTSAFESNFKLMEEMIGVYLYAQSRIDRRRYK